MVGSGHRDYMPELVHWSPPHTQLQRGAAHVWLGAMTGTLAGSPGAAAGRPFEVVAIVVVERRDSLFCRYGFSKAVGVVPNFFLLERSCRGEQGSLGQFVLHNPIPPASGVPLLRAASCDGNVRIEHSPIFSILLRKL
jgi:hypothetical protein